MPTVNMQVFEESKRHQLIRKVIIDSSKVSDNFDSFPIGLSFASGIKDIQSFAISDNGGMLPREVEGYNNTIDKQMIWFKANLKSNENKKLTLLYGGNIPKPPSNSTYGSQNVWDSNYVGVWHMNYDPNGDASNCIKDSTSYNNHGTPAGSMTTPDLVDSGYGKGIYFDALNDYIRVPDSGQELDITDYFTIESIAVPDTSVGTCVGGIFDTSGGSKQYGIFDKTTLVNFVASDPGIKDGSTVYTYTGKHYAAGTFDTSANILRLISNGAFRDSDTLNTVASPNWDLLIGARHNGSNPSATTFFDGIIEEFRVSKIVRSDNWLITIQNNCINPTAMGISPFYQSISSENGRASLIKQLGSRL